MSNWTAADIGDQTGRVAVITGANSGLGLETAIALGAKGGTVVLAGRNPERLAGALATATAKAPEGSFTTATIDLGSLASVRDGAAHLADEHDAIDLLVNNAGVMAPPRWETADGFESQFGINHLGHFALTGLLLDQLLAADAGRVVTVTSSMRRTGSIDFDDLNWRRHYRRWSAYGQSKLANLLFAVELDRRVRTAGLSLVSAAAHPGYAATNLQTSDSWLRQRAYSIGNMILAQPAAHGAWPQEYAATAPDVEGGTLYAPDKLGGMRGHPRLEKIEPKARDPYVARRLWDASAELTGVTFEALER